MSHKLAYIMQREGLPMDAQLMSAFAAEIEAFWNKRGDTTMTNETIMGDPVMTYSIELEPCPVGGELSQLAAIKNPSDASKRMKSALGINASPPGDARKVIDDCVEALDESQAVLAAIRATSVVDEWFEKSTAKHFHDICGDSMRLNMAALTAAKAYLGDG